MNESNNPSLSDLARDAGPIPEGVDLATVLIAGTDPRVLQEATTETIVESYRAKLQSDNQLPSIAEQRYERTFRNPHSRAARKAARQFLEKVLSDQQIAEEIYTPQLPLAQEVTARQYKLSSPVRWLSSISIALTFGLGTSAITYAAENTSNHVSADMAKSYNKTYGADGEKEKIPSDKITDGQIVFAGSLGVAGAIAGSVWGLFAAEKLSGRAARRRAKKIINKVS